MTYEEMTKKARAIAGKASFGLYEQTYHRAMKEMVRDEIKAQTKALREENQRLRNAQMEIDA